MKLNYICKAVYSVFAFIYGEKQLPGLLDQVNWPLVVDSVRSVDDFFQCR